MGATNSTLNYQLSQFISTDKPAWLQDYNGDMEKIDVGINTAKVAADTAQNTANSAVSSIGTVTSDITALQTNVEAHTTDITDLQGDVNTIESLIGNGQPTAGDHTLIGAINTNTEDIDAIKYQHIAFAYETKYSDIINLINASLAAGRVPHVVCDIQQANTNILGCVFNFARTGYTGGQEINFSCVITGNTIASISTTSSGSVIGATGLTPLGILNGVLYY